MTTTGWTYWVLAVLTAFTFICGPGPASAISTCRPADPDCDPHLPPPPPPPPPPTSTPDLSMQIVPCPDPSQIQFMVDRIKSDVSRALRDLDLHHDDPAPNPDVRTRCDGSRGSFATWFQPVGSYGPADTGAARDRGLAQVALLQGAEEFAARVSASGLQHLIDVSWRDVAKRMNDSGNPDPNGNVHLTSIGAAYNGAARQVTTTINGFYDGPLSDTNFWISVYDHLGVANGDIMCTTTLDSGHDTTLDTVLAAIGAVFGLGDGVPDPSAPSFLRVGPACQAAASAPAQILIPKNLAPVPQPLKEVFTYGRVDVSASGIVMGGTHDTALRELGAVISGQYRLNVPPGQMTTATFFALPYDLRPPLRATWSAPGGVVNVIGTTASITWDTRSLHQGQTAAFNIGLTITDADGFSASTSATIHVTAKTPPPDDPPICQQKPTLPQCK